MNKKVIIIFAVLIGILAIALAYYIMQLKKIAMKQNEDALVIDKFRDVVVVDAEAEVIESNAPVQENQVAEEEPKQEDHEQEQVQEPVTTEPNSDNSNQEPVVKKTYKRRIPEGLEPVVKKETRGRKKKIKTEESEVIKGETPKEILSLQEHNNNGSDEEGSGETEDNKLSGE